MFFTRQTFNEKPIVEGFPLYDYRITESCKKFLKTRISTVSSKFSGITFAEFLYFYYCDIWLMRVQQMGLFSNIKCVAGIR